MKLKRVGLLALISGMITTFLFYHFISKANAQPQEEPLVKVITAVKDIKKNERVTDDMVGVSEVPKSDTLTLALKKKEDVIGKYASVPIKKGEIILSHRVENGQDEEAIVSKKVRAGFRAVSIQAEYVESVSNLIEPEDFVDVIVTVEMKKTEEVITEIVKEKARVLSVGQRMIEKNGSGPREEYHAVTLELTKPDAVKVIQATREGHVQLILHSKREQASEADGQSVLGNTNIISLPSRSAIRSKPDLEAPIIGIVNEGENLTMTGEHATDKEDRIWLHVQAANGTKGWISSRIIKLEDE